MINPKIIDAIRRSSGCCQQAELVPGTIIPDRDSPRCRVWNGQAWIVCDTLEAALTLSRQSHPEGQS
jgi:hypothetical protein